MPNVLNTPAAIMGVIVIAILAYTFYTPMVEILAYFPTELYVFFATMFAMTLVIGGGFNPIAMLVSDDKTGQ